MAAATTESGIVKNHVGLAGPFFISPARLALLLYATRMVRTGVERAYGDVLRRRLRTTLRNPFAAILAGTGLAVVLQSATAVSLLVGSFVGSRHRGWCRRSDRGARRRSRLGAGGQDPDLRSDADLAGLPIRRHRDLPRHRATGMAPVSAASWSAIGKC